MKKTAIILLVVFLATAGGIGAAWYFGIRSTRPPDCQPFDTRSECRQSPPLDKVEIKKIDEVSQISYNCSEPFYFICVYDQTASLWEDIEISKEEKERILKLTRDRCLDFVEETFQKSYHRIVVKTIPLGTLTGYGALPVVEVSFECQNIPALPSLPIFPLLPEIPYPEKLGLNSGERFGIDCQVHTEEKLTPTLRGMIGPKQWECVDRLSAYNREIEEFNTKTLLEYNQEINEWRRKEKSREAEFLAKVAKELDKVGKLLSGFAFRPRDGKKTEFPCRRKGGPVKFEDCSDFTRIPALALGIIEDLKAKYGKGKIMLVIISDFLIENISVSENLNSGDLSEMEVVLVEYKVSQSNHLSRISKMFEQAGAKVTIRSF
ncbi:MAG: hypothetical protein AB1465_04190 [Patescibacteria group bacterium]